MLAANPGTVKEEVQDRPYWSVAGGPSTQNWPAVFVKSWETMPSGPDACTCTPPQRVGNVPTRHDVWNARSVL